jgi:hypothetical protein
MCSPSEAEGQRIRPRPGQREHIPPPARLMPSPAAPSPADAPGSSSSTQVAATLLESLARTTDADVQAFYLKEAQTRT